jgi:flagellar hook-length control protein FliK
MTITPMAPMPVPPADPTGAPVATGAPGGGAAVDTFGALIAAQLDQLVQLGHGAGPDTDDAACGPADQPAPSPEDDPTSDAPMSPLPPDLALLALAAGPPLVATPTLAVAAVAAGPVPAPTPTPLVADAAVADGDGVVAPAGTGTRADQAPGHTGLLPTRAAPAGPEHAHSGGGSTGLPTDVAVGAAATAPVDATPVVVPTDQTATAPQPPASNAVAATTAPALGAVQPVVTTDAGMSAAAPVPANPVLDQVAPVFTRLVSGPEGQHRMTLRLHPADLGEIHLTVTVRGDSVDVTVSATPEARELLADGSGQLRALLDSVGRSADRIVFRDLPGTGSTVQVISTSGGGPQPDGHAASSYGDPAGGHRNGEPGHGRGADLRRPDHGDAGRAGGVPTTTSPTRTATGLVRGGLDVRM